MEELNAGALIAACSDEAVDAGITIRSVLEPLSGPGAPVKPASYEGGRFQEDRRWWGSGTGRRPVEVLVIDNEPSQANRLEAALEQHRVDLGLPEIVLDLAPVGALPPHLPGQISSFRFPHRNADAYLRDAMLDGAKFLNTEMGTAIFAATADNPEALLRWFPQALLFGFWQSHLGKKRSQAKLARAWVSEIIGIEPASTIVRRLGLKGDPLNLSVPEEKVEFDQDAQDEWHLAGPGRRPKLADIGHGQVPVTGEDAALAAVSFREVVQQAFVSFAALRRVRPEAGAAEARALLASLGLVAHVAAFGRPFSLRSGAELRPAATSWTWLGEGGEQQIEPPSLEAATRVFRACVSRAERAGLPVGSRWSLEPLTLTPAGNLAAAIRKTWPGN
jgi:CRISPR-associated protein Csb1